MYVAYGCTHKCNGTKNRVETQCKKYTSYTESQLCYTKMTQRQERDEKQTLTVRHIYNSTGNDMNDH